MTAADVAAGTLLILLSIGFGIASLILLVNAALCASDKLFGDGSKR